MQRAEDYLNIHKPDLDTRLTSFYDDVSEAIIRAKPSMKGELKFASKLPMHALGFKERTEFFKRYREIIGFDEALNGMANKGDEIIMSGLGNIPDTAGSNIKRNISRIYSELDMTGGKNPFGRIRETLSDAASTGEYSLSNIYANMNIQFRDRLLIDRAGLVTDTAGKATGAGASHYFTIGLNSIPSRDAIKQTKYRPDLLKGKKILTYDVETAGLAHGQIREVAYSRRSGAGKFEAQKPLRFTPDEFNRGVVADMADTSTGVNLRKFLSDHFDFASPASTSGDEFAEGMRPFLKAILESDYIVGHNITGFDNEQVFTGLARTNLYKKNGEFTKLVDSAFERVRDRSIDTMHLVRQMPGLKGIKTSQLLSRTGDKSKFSISNLLLQTDLMDRIGVEDLAELMGFDGTDFKFGLHHGDVDTAVTNAILEAQDTGGLKYAKGGFVPNAPGASRWAGLSEGEVLKRVRENIRISSAITPVTNLRVGQLTDDVLKRAVKDYNNKGILRTGSSDSQKALHKLLRENPEEAYEALRHGTRTPSSVRISAIQQKILRERDIAGGISDSGVERGNVIGRINALRDKRGRQAGIAFSGLSSDEKEIGYGIARATSGLGSLGGREQQVAGLADDLMVGRFNLFTSDKAQYVTRSGRASLPAQMLREAGIFKKGKNENLFLSVVERTEKADSAINVVRSLNSGEVKKLKKFIGGAVDDDILLGKALGLSEKEVKEKAPNALKQLARFREAVHAEDGLLTRLDRGVSVAQIYEGDDGGIVGKITDVFRRHFNTEGQLRDPQMESVRLFGDVDYDAGLLRTYGAVEDIGGLKNELPDIGRAVEGTKKAYEQTLGIVDDPLKFRMAKMVKGSKVSQEKVQKIYNAATDFGIPHLNKGLLGIAGVLGGALLFSRHKENERLNETLDFQGQEGSSPGQYGIYSQIQERIDAGYEGYGNQMDPLATASVTSSLNANRVGHSNYSWNRSNEIYGGIL